MRTAKLVLFFCGLYVLLAAPMFAQTDSTGGGVPAVDPHMAFVLGLAGLAAFIAQWVGTALVNQWNKIGGWLEHMKNGSKRAVAIALIGVLGLAANGVLSALTHSTNWVATFFLSLLGGVIAVVSTGMAIDTAKTKMAVNAKFASRPPAGI